MTLRQRSVRSARLAFERLPDSAREEIRHRVAGLRGLDRMKVNQALLARRLADLQVRLDGSPGEDDTPVDSRFPPGIRSRICTEEQFHHRWYESWCERLSEEPRINRKQWEHVYIARCATATGVVAPGARALGFGVGHEPLVAHFAGAAMEVVATDLDPHDEGSMVWHNTGQHASSLDPLRRPELCDETRFDQLVTWRPVDMRAIPGDLSGFDLCWSSCCFEHLGSLEAGVEFVEASLATLRPGGLAVHTTEFNLSSNGATIETGSVVLYRRRDLEALVDRLEAEGHMVAALDLAPGIGVLDEFVDVPPFVDDPHIRIDHRGHVVTSVALVIKKGELVPR